MSAETLIHPDTAPNPTTVAYFIRVDGTLRQVEPITKPHREQAHVRVRMVRDGSIVTVHNTEILRSY